MRNNFLGLPMEMLMPREPMWSHLMPTMKTDIIENDDNFKIIMDMPGFSKEDVKITIKNNTLMITAEKEAVEDKEENNYILKERSSSTMSRSFNIKGLNADSVKASFKDGVLQVVVDKPEKTEDVKTINID